MTAVDLMLWALAVLVVAVVVGLLVLLVVAVVAGAAGAWKGRRRTVYRGRRRE